MGPVGGTKGSNVADTDLLTFIVSEHVGPLQSPDQPVNIDPAAGTAISVTGVPAS